MRKVYAIVICTIISIVLVAISIVILPFCVAIELMFFLNEALGDDSFYHSLWPTAVLRFADFVKEAYDKLVNDFLP